MEQVLETVNSMLGLGMAEEGVLGWGETKSISAGLRALLSSSSGTMRSWDLGGDAGQLSHRTRPQEASWASGKTNYHLPNAEETSRCCVSPTQQAPHLTRTKPVHPTAANCRTCPLWDERTPEPRGAGIHSQ